MNTVEIIFPRVWSIEQIIEWSKTGNLTCRFDVAGALRHVVKGDLQINLVFPVIASGEIQAALSLREILNNIGSKTQECL